MESHYLFLQTDCLNQFLHLGYRYPYPRSVNRWAYLGKVSGMVFPRMGFHLEFPGSENGWEFLHSGCGWEFPRMVNVKEYLLKDFLTQYLRRDFHSVYLRSESGRAYLH
jgi:hypothetical protein